MWFSEQALVFIDTRSAALAVYRETPFGPRLSRFAFERFGSKARDGAPFADILADSREALSRLAREMKAPPRASLLLPLGVTFPSIVDTASLGQSAGSEVALEDLVRFRIAPLLPFPVTQAEVRAESSPLIGPRVQFAQAILKSTILEGEKLMEAAGFRRAHVTSALSAALRGLPPIPRIVDLIFGDSACAIAVRDAAGAIEAIHLRLLAEGDDRAQRSIDEACRAGKSIEGIRVIGEEAQSLATRASEIRVTAAFGQGARVGSADPQVFPFLAVLHQDSK